MGDPCRNLQHEGCLSKVKFESRRSCPLHESAETSGASEDLRYFGSVQDKLTGQSFQILRCSSCGVGLTDPYPTEATVRYLYEGRGSVVNFDPIRGTVMDHLKDLSALRDLRWVHRMGNRPKILSVLDFGTGNGRFSLASKKEFRGCQVDAMDFDIDPPLALVGVEGVRYLSHEDFPRSGLERYDLIPLRHVLEHVHDPIGFLRSMTYRLSAGGILYIEVPNLESAYIRHFGSIANAFSVPYHLFNFDANSLETVVRTAGLRCRMATRGQPLAGCVLASLLNQERSLVHQLVGVMIHPIQMVMDWMHGKYILAAVCKLDVAG